MLSQLKVVLDGNNKLGYKDNSCRFCKNLEKSHSMADTHEARKKQYGRFPGFRNIKNGFSVACNEVHRIDYLWALIESFSVYKEG